MSDQVIVINLADVPEPAPHLPWLPALVPDDDPLTWENLVRHEPRLSSLYGEARDWHWRAGDDRHFCANDVWYGYRGHAGIKPRLRRLVGWTPDRDDPLLRTSAAWDLAYETIYAALPDCRDCGCWR